jgi:hypothetical protein
MKGFKIFRGIFLTFFIALIPLKIYLRITNDIALNSKSMFILLGFILALSFRNKLTWVLAISLFVGGLYNLFVTAHHAAEPTAMQFAEPLCNTLFPRRDFSIAERLIGTIPEFFCIIGLVLFLTRYVRQLYWNKI